jgi:hypothetical protein
MKLTTAGLGSHDASAPMAIRVALRLAPGRVVDMDLPEAEG